MIIWIITIGALVILSACIVIDKIRFDRDVRVYERTHDARLRQLLGDLHNH